jgi:outer membrane protein OmpA-like peptidoglycan-associated protein
MTQRFGIPSFFPGQCAVVLLASALVVPAGAQQSQPSSDPQNTPPAAASQQPSSASPANTDKEGFWGHVNPFARKKWVKKRLDPINDRLTELDQVNAKNATDIKDVDARAQAGIQHAQATADAANQTATAAGTQAQNASNVAQGASGHVDKLNTTVNGLDQYHQISDVDLPFHGSAMLSKDAKAQLDTLAASLTGHQGYIVEIEAHAPGAGAVGIQSSQRLAESVERYMVTEHQIPVYRMHFVALGNAPIETPGADPNAKPARIRNGSVHIRLMENSLAAQDSTSPHGL